MNSKIEIDKTRDGEIKFLYNVLFVEPFPKHDRKQEVQMALMQLIKHLFTLLDLCYESQIHRENVPDERLFFPENLENLAMSVAMSDTDAQFQDICFDIISHEKFTNLRQMSRMKPDSFLRCIDEFNFQQKKLFDDFCLVSVQVKKLADKQLNIGVPQSTEMSNNIISDSDSDTSACSMLGIEIHDDQMETSD